MNKINLPAVIKNAIKTKHEIFINGENTFFWYDGDYALIAAKDPKRAAEISNLFARLISPHNKMEQANATYKAPDDSKSKYLVELVNNAFFKNIVIEKDLFDSLLHEYHYILCMPHQELPFAPGIKCTVSFTTCWGVIPNDGGTVLLSAHKN